MLPVQINSFAASPSSLPAPGSVVVSWITSNADAVELDGVPVAASGSMTFPLSGSHTFYLTAHQHPYPGNPAAEDKVQASCVVSVDTAAINSFTATPPSLPPGGGAVTLSWNATGVAAVLNGNKLVPLAGSTTIVQTVTKTHKLQVVGGGAPKIATVTVTVA